MTNRNEVQVEDGEWDGLPSPHRRRGPLVRAGGPLPGPDDGTDDVDVLIESANIRARVLNTARDLINGDRNNQYGDPRQDFKRTAEIWTSMLAHKLKPGEEIEPHEMALMMVGVKVSRAMWSGDKADHYVDIAGYAGCAADCAEELHTGGLSGWPS